MKVRSNHVIYEGTIDDLGCGEGGSLNAEDLWG